MNTFKEQFPDESLLMLKYMGDCFDDIVLKAASKALKMTPEEMQACDAVLDEESAKDYFDKAL